MTDDALAAQIEKFAGVRVVCIGDAMLDRFVYGEVERTSPEAPIPICRVVHEAAMPGGAGNVVANILALGAGVDFFAVTGDDEAGSELAALLDGREGLSSTIVSETGRQTTIKTRYLAAGQQLLRADRETTAAITPSTAEALYAGAVRALEGAGALVLSDYGKGVLGDDLIAKLIVAARTANRPVVVDPKGNNFARYRGATLVKPNRHELALAARMDAGGDAEIEAAAESIRRSCNVDAVLVTRSADGMTLVSPDGPSHLPAEAREVFDVSGAGDTVVAVLATAIAAGLSLLDAARIANAAAGIVVAKTGTAQAFAEDLAAALRGGNAHLGDAKIMTAKAALDRVLDWRRRGLRVGFTNGCFDLIHPGHVSLLAQARGACDRLVVGLNSDSSARKLKGEGRPVQTESARAAVLASLSSVDAVVIFSEQTPIKLIEAVRPEVLVKGADYKRQDVVGAEFVEGHGGEVLLAEIAPGHSTTATLARIAK